jgi:ADP-heptose:LPS heptosyltransferase
MKILVLQLARLGDIYQTWPVIRAIKRSCMDIDESVEIHLLTRAKFSEAVTGLKSIHRHWVLDSRSVLEPLIDERPNFEVSQSRLNELCDSLLAEQFDKIINLSFSPLSSEIVAELSSVSRPPSVHGYTRTSDGYLAIPDDTSAYFYAQTGPAGVNRIHVTDLFAGVAGVELDDSDYREPKKHIPDVDVPLKNSMLLHIGASDSQKTLSLYKWQQVVRQLLTVYDGDVVLIGATEEQEFAAEIESVQVVASQVGSSLGELKPAKRSALNLVGKTNLTELFLLIASAKMLIGGDSGPIHIATLTNTPVLNLSFSSVSFWETGPKSAGSRIIVAESQELIQAETIVAEALAMLSGCPPVAATAVIYGPTRAVELHKDQKDDFAWELLMAIYLGAEFPKSPSMLFLKAVENLDDINNLALEQLSILRARPDSQIASGILDRSDEVIEQIGQMVAEIAPLVRWFQTERIRIGPMPSSELIDATSDVHLRLRKVLSAYVNRDLNSEVGAEVIVGVAMEGVTTNDNVNLGS